MCEKFYQARVCVSTDGNMDRRTHGQADTPTNGHTGTRSDGQSYLDCSANPDSDYIHFIGSLQPSDQN